MLLEMHAHTAEHPNFNTPSESQKAKGVITKEITAVGVFLIWHSGINFL
jgi:hypothetical protein